MASNCPTGLRVVSNNRIAELCTMSLCITMGLRVVSNNRIAERE